MVHGSISAVLLTVHGFGSPGCAHTLHSRDTVPHRGHAAPCRPLAGVSSGMGLPVCLPLRRFFCMGWPRDEIAIAHVPNAKKYIYLALCAPVFFCLSGSCMGRSRSEIRDCACAHRNGKCTQTCARNQFFLVGTDAGHRLIGWAGARRAVVADMAVPQHVQVSNW